MRQEAIVRLDQGGFTHELIMSSMDKNFTPLITLLLQYMSTTASKCWTLCLSELR